MKKVLSLILVLILMLTLGTVMAEKPQIKGDLVLYSSMTDNDLNNLLDLIAEEFPDLTVDIVNGSAGELTARLRAESANPIADMMWGGLNNGDGQTHADLFEHWLTQYEEQIYPDYRSNNGFYNFDHLSTIVFCVNKQLEEELGIQIKGYQDLLNPALKGRIVMPDPNSSSSAWNNLCNILAVFGYGSDATWDYVKAFLNNGVVISTSSSVAFKSVDAGEYVVGLTYEDGAATLHKAGSDKTRMVFPEEGASAFAFGCAVVKNAPNMDAAKAVVELLMSPEGQSRLGNALGTLRFTNMNADYSSPYLPDTDEITWVTRDMDWLVPNKAMVLEKWNAIYNAAH